jgi:hypothetical protein
MTNHYLLWSGGYDSTSLLVKLGKESSEDNPVHVIDCNYTNGLNKNQYEAQKLAKIKILKILRSRGYHIEEHQITVSIDGIAGANIIQPFWWITSALNVIPDDSMLHLGYVSDDGFCSWGFKKEISEIFYSGCAIMGKKDVALLYDYKYVPKTIIIRNIKKAGLYDICWTCERPIKKGRKYVACNVCEKCQELKVANYALKLQEEINKSSKME